MIEWINEQEKGIEMNSKIDEIKDEYIFKRNKPGIFCKKFIKWVIRAKKFRSLEYASR